MPPLRCLCLPWSLLLVLFSSQQEGVKGTLFASLLQLSNAKTSDCDGYRLAWPMIDDVCMVWREEPACRKDSTQNDLHANCSKQKFFVPVGAGEQIRGGVFAEAM